MIHALVLLIARSLRCRHTSLAAATDISTTETNWAVARADAVVARERVTQALRAMGLSPLDSRGNFVCVPVPDAPVLAERLADRGVAVGALAGLPVFGAVLRVGMGPWPVREQFVGALREALP